MSFAIPVIKDSSHFFQTMDFDGVSYQLHFDWNDRDNRWYFSLADSNGVFLSAGNKILIESPIAFRVAGGPNGFFIAGDSTPEGSPPGYADLGNRVKFAYISMEE